MRIPNAANGTSRVVALLAVLALTGTAAFVASAQTLPPPPADTPAFNQEQLEQILAPIALYPDELLSQMLMASTYPLEVVQADRWVKQNPGLTGDALTNALETQSWDPSVKSLVNFPQVLAMMNDKLDVTAQIGDAFIGQQDQVMQTIQTLRARAAETGNLKTTSQQTVTVDQGTPTPTYVIQPADPQVVYIPMYSPDVYYSTWPYPAYPPVAYYPPGYYGGRGFAFGAGITIGVAWGYAWGHCDWHGRNVNIDVNRNINYNRNINRSRYTAEYRGHNANFQNGQGSFRHDPTHRQGVAYRDQRTASQFGRVSSADATRARESYRGRAGTGAADLSRPGPGAARPSVTPARPNVTPARPNVTPARPNVTPNRSGGITGGAVPSQRPATAKIPSSTNRPNAFEGVNRGGSTARVESSRGSASRSGPARSAPSRSGGGRSGGRR